MATRLATPSRPRKAAIAVAQAERPPILYVHGIGAKPAPEMLEREWDLALFGREMGERTRMAYWADILHGKAKPATVAKRAVRRSENLDPAALLAEAGVDPDDADARALTEALLANAGVVTAGRRTKVLPLPAFLRKPIARLFIEALIKDSAAYFFKPDVRARIRKRFDDLLPRGNEPVVVVAHSQGTVIALEALAERARRG